VALIDYPSHSNVGDSAVWLGELAYLRSLGCVSIRYTCDVNTYSRVQLSQQIDHGVILLSGGGNLGDVWEESQDLRERVIRDFPDTRIIQLPQSIHFQHRSALMRARKVFDSHPALTLLLRDQQSLGFARKEFRNPAHLCPDMACFLGPLERPCPPTKAMVWLSRTDRESPGQVETRLAPDIDRIDWLAEPLTKAMRVKALLDRQLMLHPRSLARLNQARSRLCEQVARQRLSRGCLLLAAGRTVLTDRLHGHILSMLLGIPQILMDNGTGKVRSFYETWTSSLPLVRWSSSPSETLALARNAALQTGV
jgi:pyruvyl transferase EpsO